MAEAFARKLPGVEAASAGTSPGDALNPAVVAVMEELGISMEGHYPKMLTPEMYKGDVCVIRMG